MATVIIDRAIEAGIPRQDLRWRLGRAQRAAVLEAMTLYKSVLLFEMYETGAIDSGMFCGLPFVMDPTIPEGTVILEQVATVKTVEEINSLAIPVGYPYPGP